MLYIMLILVVLLSIIGVSVRLYVMRKRDRESGVPPAGIKKILTVIGESIFGISSVLLACAVLAFLCMAMLKYLMFQPILHKDIPYESFVSQTGNKFSTLPRSVDFKSMMIADHDPVWFCYDVLEKDEFDKFISENRLRLSTAPENVKSLDFLNEYIRAHNFDVELPDPSDHEWKSRHGYADNYGVWIFWKDNGDGRIRMTLVAIDF